MMTTEATRWTIQKEEAVTFCDDRHPVRLGRTSEHYQGEPWERKWALDSGKKGYLCPGGMDHTYPVWVVFDANHPQNVNAGVFDEYRLAVKCRAELLRKEVACPKCPHAVGEHLLYNENGLLTVNSDYAVLSVCGECKCRAES